MMESEQNEQLTAMLPPDNAEEMLAMMQRNNPAMYARFQSLNSEQKDVAMQNMLAHAAAVRSGRIPTGHGHGHSHGPEGSGSCRHSHSSPTIRASQPVQRSLETTPPSQMNIVQAVQHNEIGRVKELIDSGQADVNAPDSERCYLLHWAAINNHVELVRYLITCGAEVDVKGGDLQSTPLHWSCRQGCTEIFFLLIDNGAAIDSTDIHGVQPIHLAAEYNQIKMVAFLLGSGIDVDCKDGRGFTPLMHAALGPPQGFNELPGTTQVNCVQFLLSFGASINYQEQNNHFTALHLAVGNFNTVSLFALTEDPEINIHLKNLKGETPLELGIARRNKAAKDVLELMIESNKLHVRPLAMQRCASKKTIRDWLTRLYLFVIMSMIGLTFNLEDYSIWTRIFIIFCVFMGLTYFFKYYFFDDNMGQNLALSYLISSTLLMYITYMIYLQKYIWTLPNLIYHFLTLHGLFTVYTVRNVNPGFLNRQFTGLDGTSMSKEKICLAFARDPRWSLENFCISCLIRRPLRSKHCPVDRTCVAKFDHHCTWLGACIGFRNHHFFIRILICGMIALHIWLYKAYQMISKDAEDFTYKFLFTNYYESWWIYMLVVTVFNGFWVTLMTIFHLINSICYGLTLNERLIGMRYAYFRNETTNEYRNPFSKPILKNFLETLGFFRLMGSFGYVRTDWTQIYDLNQIQGLKLA